MDLKRIVNPHFKYNLYSIESGSGNGGEGKTSWILPETAIFDIDKWSSFELRPSDIFVVSFPKCGSTFLSEIVSSLLNYHKDFENFKRTKLIDRQIFYEYGYPGLDAIKRMESPRLIRTHLPIELLPVNVAKNSKVLYVVRNPKDTLVSYYYFMKNLRSSEYSGTFNELMMEFMESKVPYAPWCTHVEEYFKTPEVYCLFYEDLITKPLESVKGICEFLSVKNMTDEGLNEIVNWCSFSNMQSNENINYNWYNCFKNDFKFFRQGKIGDWRNYFTEKTSQEFDTFIRGNLKLKIDFNYGEPVPNGLCHEEKQK